MITDRSDHSGFAHDPAKLEGQANAMFENCDRDRPILVGELALLAIQNGTSVGADAEKYLAENPLQILTRPTHYPADQQEAMYRRADAVVETFGQHLAENGGNLMRYIQSFYSLKDPSRQAPRADAALALSAGLLDTNNTWLKKHLIEEVIPALFVKTERTDIKQFALSQLVANGIPDLHAYFKHQHRHFGMYKGVAVPSQGGANWQKDHLNMVAVNAYAANEMWPMATTMAKRVENQRLRGSALARICIGLETLGDADQQSLAQQIEQEVRQIRNSLRHPASSSNEEYQQGWRELGLGLAAIHIVMGDHSVSRRYLDESADAALQDARSAVKVLVKQYQATGEYCDRKAAINFIQDRVTSPQTYLEALKRIMVADYDIGFVRKPGPERIDSKGKNIDYPGKGVPAIVSQVFKLVKESNVPELQKHELIGQIVAACSDFMASSGCSISDMNSLLACVRMFAEDRPSMARVLLNNAKVVRSRQTPASTLVVT